MNISISNDTWVFAIIKHPGGSEQLTGFQDEAGVKYIPVLKTRKAAEVFLSYMNREPGVRYEIQAIIFEDILKYSRENQFCTCIVDEKGVVQEKVAL
ncbi:MAG: hypothetical protein KJ737_00290 [Proteobacteria bacterium]|nr:hypothetical protein [Pseudomonadota bacterium]